MNFLEKFRPRIEDELREIVIKGRSPLLGLDTMLAYHLGFTDQFGNEQDSAKGKYLRPLSCLAMCAGLGGKIEQALPAAASLELAHRTSLIFDDIQDKGKERNNRPTVWSIWGVAQAINAGFALSSYAHIALHRLSRRGVPDTVTLEVWRELETAILLLCQGQFMDISFMDRDDLTVDDYLGMVCGKTGFLFATACGTGAMIAAASHRDVELAKDFGLNMGIAFQIHDDYLGVWGDEATVGKTANDLIEKKRALPIVLALQDYPEAVRGFLGRETISPIEAEMMKSSMETHGIPQRVNDLEAEYIRKARVSLEGLSLKKEWSGQFEEVLSFLSDRKV